MMSGGNRWRLYIVVDFFIQQLRFVAT